MAGEPQPLDGGEWLASLEARASRGMPPAVWSYVQSGSYGEVTAAEATAAWRAVRFRPRVLRGHADVDLETSLLKGLKNP